MSKDYFVYVHILKYSPHYAYVGITTDLEKRFSNGLGYVGLAKFQKAIDYYGWEQFKHIVLGEKLTKEEALKEEARYIELYDSINNGYNTSNNGKWNNTYCFATEDFYKNKPKF